MKAKRVRKKAVKKNLGRRATTVSTRSVAKKGRRRRGVIAHGSRSREYGVLDCLTIPFTASPYTELDTNDLLTVAEKSARLYHPNGSGNYTSGTTRVVTADYGDGFFSSATAQKIRIRWKYHLAANNKSWTSYVHFYETTYFVSPFVMIGFTKNTGSDSLRIKLNVNGTEEKYPLYYEGLAAAIPLTRYIELFLQKGSGIDKAICNVYTDAYKTIVGTANVSISMDYRKFAPWYDNTSIIDSNNVDEKFSEYSMVKYL